MPRVHISIGSNIDREQNIRGAVRALRQAFGKLALSGVYETAAVGFEGEPFYNLVAAFDTDQTPESVQAALKRIETEHGRMRENATRYAARTIDLDILLYGDLVRHDAQFDIPRGEILQQAYVLAPLAEIAPTLRHPESRCELATLWNNLKLAGALRNVRMDLKTESDHD